MSVLLEENKKESVVCLSVTFCFSYKRAPLNWKFKYEDFSYWTLHLQFNFSFECNQVSYHRSQL